MLNNSILVDVFFWRKKIECLQVVDLDICSVIYVLEVRRGLLCLDSLVLYTPSSLRFCLGSKLKQIYCALFQFILIAQDAWDVD
jgi:hypothetical protein